VWLEEFHGVPVGFLVTRYLLPIVVLVALLVGFLVSAYIEDSTRASVAVQPQFGTGRGVGLAGTPQAVPGGAAWTSAVGTENAARARRMEVLLAWAPGMALGIVWLAWGSFALDRRARTLLRARFEDDANELLVDWRYGGSEASGTPHARFAGPEASAVGRTTADRALRRRRVLRSALLAGATGTVMGLLRQGLLFAVFGAVFGASLVLVVASVATFRRERVRARETPDRLRVLPQGLLYGQELQRFARRLRGADFEPGPTPRIRLDFRATGYHDEPVWYPVPPGRELEAVDLCRELRRISRKAKD
jgi:hypothetical protein